MQRNSLKRREWSDLSPFARISMVVSGLVQVALLLAALWDIRGRAADEIRGNKLMWVALSFINFIGPISYFTIGRKR